MTKSSLLKILKNTLIGLLAVSLSIGVVTMQVYAEEDGQGEQQNPIVHTEDDVELNIYGVYEYPDSTDGFTIGKNKTLGIMIDAKFIVKDNYKLVITIPKGNTLNYYPNHTSSALNPFLVDGSNSVVKTTDSDGNTVLSYDFNSMASDIIFNITIIPEYSLKNNSDNNILLEVYYGEDAISSADTSIKIKDLSEMYGAVTTECDKYYYESVTEEETYIVIPKIYLSNKYSDYNTFDSVTAIVPLTRDFDTGYLEESVFKPFSDKQVNKIIYNDVEVGQVTYYESWNDYDSNINYDLPILVYDLNEYHPFCDSSSFIYLSANVCGNIRFSFSKETLDDKLSGKDNWESTGKYKGMITTKIHGENVVMQNTISSSLTYGGFKIETGGTVEKNFDITFVLRHRKFSDLGSVVLNYREDGYLRTYYDNIVSKPIQSMTIEYQFNEKLSLYKIEATFIDFFPTVNQYADVKYKTALGGDTVFSCTLSDTKPVCELKDENDVIIWIEATYYNLSSSGSLMDFYIYNKNYVDDTVKVSADITSLICDGVSEEDISKVITQEEFIHNVDLRKFQNIYLRTQTSYKEISKGGSYSFSFGTYSSYNSRLFDNPTFYILMPKGFIYKSLSEPSSLASYPKTFTIENITLSSDDAALIGVDAGDYSLFTLSYEGENIEINNLFSLDFNVGPLVDASVYKPKLYLPAAIYATSDNPLFKYSEGYKSYDYLDLDKDQNTNEKFAYPNMRATVTMNSTLALSIESFITSEYSDNSENTTQSYRNGDSGTYNYYIYNGLSSGVGVKEVETIIALAKLNDEHHSSNNKYSSVWNTYLSGEVSSNSDFFDGFTVEYSIDGGQSYHLNVEEYSKITHVKVRSSSEKMLMPDTEASFSFPFVTDFASGISLNKIAYISSNTSYIASNQTQRSSIDLKLHQLYATSHRIDGLVYNDFDGDLIQGKEEKTIQSNHEVILYKGEYTSKDNGLTILSEITTDINGNFRFNDKLYDSGKYTIRINKDSALHFPVDLSGWNFEGDYAYYTFDLSSQSIVLPIVYGRNIVVTGFEDGGVLHKGDNPQLLVDAYPKLSGSDQVLFSSSNSKIVSVDSDGKLTFVSEGDAVITITVPQVEDLVSQIGKYATKTIVVRARAEKYSVTLYLNGASLTHYNFSNTVKNTYVATQLSGTALKLPTIQYLTIDNEAEQFVGWYTNPEFKGEPYTLVPAENGKDIEYWAKIESYEALYDSRTDGWVYNSFSRALSNVKSDGEIILLKDISVDGNVRTLNPFKLITDGEKRIIDFNDNYVMTSSRGNTIIDDSNLTIITSAKDGPFMNLGNGKITIKNVTILNSNKENSALGNVKNLFIEGGTLVGTYAIDTSSFNISGAPVLKGKTADIRFSGKLTINGELTNTKPYRLEIVNPVAGKIIGVANDVDYSSHFTTSQGYVIGYNSDKELFLRQIVIVTPTKDQFKDPKDEDPEFTYTTSIDIELTGELSREEGEEVGRYKYTLGTLSCSEEYILVLSNLNTFRIGNPIDEERKLDDVPNTSDINKVSFSKPIIHLYIDQEHPKKDKIKGRSLLFVMILLGMLFILGGCQKKIDIEKISLSVITGEPVEEVVNIKELKSLNKDCVGWLNIEGTNISYPVTQHLDDENYYLRRDFYGKDDNNGTLILDNDSDLNELGSNLIIHGHNMHSGEMFGQLEKYIDYEYIKEHNTIQFIDEDGIRNYEVYAVFYSKVYYEDEDVFKYYKYFGGSETEFNDFIENVSELSSYNSGIEPEYGDEFITLSTCAYHIENGRFVVIGIRVE